MLTWHPIKIKLADLKPFDRNPRTISASKFESLKKSLDDLGEFKPLVVDYDQRTILSGNQRYRAMLEKYNLSHEVDCYIPSRELSEAEREKVVVVDNGHHGTWNYEELANFSIDLGELDLDISIPEIELPEVEQIEGQCDDDEVPSEIGEPITKRGDVWLVGKHKVMCGDSTMIDDVERLMGGEKADMVFTDPPYSQETQGGFKGIIGAALKKQAEDIESLCDFDPKEFLQMLPTFFNKKMNSYIFTSKDLLPDYLRWAKENKYSFNVLVWKKPNAIPIGGSHRPDIEYMLLFRRSGIFNGAIPEVNYSKVLEHKRETGLHPTMKPIDIITNQLLIGSNKDSLVVDPFLGSGSTLIACEKTNRKCYGMELDGHYCDVIIERYLRFTGRDDVYLESTGEKYLDLKEKRDAKC